MSFQAMTWAIEQKTGSPRAKCVLLSLANYANAQWCAYPKQELIAEESEQSTDSVQKYMLDLIGPGLLRRIKLKRFGRRTHDFLILQPSPLFDADLETIRAHLPSGCDVMEDAAASDGSVAAEDSSGSSDDSEHHAAASDGSTTLPLVAVDAADLQRQQEPVTNQESQPQTPSQETAGNQGSEDSKPDLSGLDKFRETYPRPSSKPEADAELWAALDARAREQVQHGAHGARLIFNKNPKSSGVVGPTRFLQSEPLWAEYGRYAPAAKAPPPPRVFVCKGSDEWHARTVLGAIIDVPMPEPKHSAEHGCDGADFLGHLPLGGMALAQFVDQFGVVNPETWAIIDRDKNPQQIGAWRERIRECTGREIELKSIDLGGINEHTVLGKVYKIPRRILGLRVPQPFPPAKGSTHDPPKESSAA